MSQSERLVLATRYRLVSEIGQGANGTVWRGHDELLDRAVAIKELRLPPDLSEEERVVFYRRTLREARAPAQLRTPSIVEVYDVVIEQGRPWIVMELIEAPNLEQLIETNGPLPPERVAHIGRQLLDALAVAHRSGIIHRDIKPSNVLLDGDRVVLTDFGLAFSSGATNLTKSGHFMGSPAYVAPEVAAGERATPQSDLWSLGATLYAAVEGRPPFDRGNVMATLSALANEEPPPAQNAGPLAPVLSGLLQKNPLRRLSHARAADRLERAMSAPRSARRQAMPAASSTAKSPTSCGISWAITARVVDMPWPTPPANAAPMAKPSTRLWRASLQSTSGAAAAIGGRWCVGCPGCAWRQRTSRSKARKPRAPARKRAPTAGAGAWASAWGTMSSIAAPRRAPTAKAKRASSTGRRVRPSQVTIAVPARAVPLAIRVAAMGQRTRISRGE